jgi:transposase
MAGMCPGNNESAGAKKSGKVRNVNGVLKGILPEVAWAASRSKGSAYSAIYDGIAKRRGKKRALIALGHRILCNIYRVLTTGEVYVDEGDEAVFERNLKTREGATIRALERSGYTTNKITA